MESKMFTLGLVVLFCIVQSNSALKCYTCTSVSNPKCADPKDKGLETQECIVESVLAQGASWMSFFGVTVDKKDDYVPACMKLVTRNGTALDIDRRCSIKTKSQEKCTALNTGTSKPGGNNPIVSCELCAGDACNSGNSIQMFSALIVFSAMICTARLFA